MTSSSLLLSLPEGNSFTSSEPSDPAESARDARPYDATEDRRASEGCSAALGWRPRLPPCVLLKMDSARDARSGTSCTAVLPRRPAVEARLPRGISTDALECTPPFGAPLANFSWLSTDERRVRSARGVVGA